MRNHPRSLQVEIGPSEIGEPCTRKFAGAGLPDLARPDLDLQAAWVVAHGGFEVMTQLVGDQNGVAAAVEVAVGEGGEVDGGHDDEPRLAIVSRPGLSVP